MIRPLNNICRSATDLSGIWRIRFDPDDVGRLENWGGGIGEADSHAIAIPGSWNEQLAEAGYMNYVGAAWLETRFFIPEVEAGRTLTLRFGSADYHAEVWVNGIYAGASGAAMLPFEVGIDGLVEAGQEARLVGARHQCAARGWPDARNHEGDLCRGAPPARRISACCAL